MTPDLASRITAPRRIQRKRAKGWKMPKGAVYVGRPTKWGNTRRIGKDGTAEECVAAYRRIIDGNVWTSPNNRDIKAELRGRDLCCWCPLDQPCHADFLLEIANG